MKKEKKVAPLIVDGELYSSKKYMAKFKKKKEKEVKLPTKRFTIVDWILTLIGVLMVGYGIYGLVKDNKEEKKKSIEIQVNYQNYNLNR